MRAAALVCAVLGLAGCRSRTTPGSEPGPASPVGPAPAEPSARSQEAAPPAVAAEPPPEAAIVRALEPVYAEVRRCLSQTPVPTDAGVRRLELRIGIQPSGVVRTVELDGWPPARECMGTALRQMRFPSWRGQPTLLTLPLGRDGTPMPISVDAAADGAR